ALARGRADGSSEVIETVPLEGGTFSAQLVPQISALLSRQNFTKNDIAGFAVASGPGSFTGLRVGLAAIKALAEILGKPIAAVSLLEAVAAAGEGSVVAALDAGRNEVYVGLYDGSQMQEERLIPRAELTGVANGRVVLTPDPIVAEVVPNARAIEYPGSAAIARIGWKKIGDGETISAEDLEANY